MPYPRVANQFVDPIPASAGGLGTYDWHVNHLEEEGPFRSNNVEFDGRSDGQGVVATGGEYEPLILTLTGRILHRAQNVEFWKWRHLNHSFRFLTFEGEQYEVSMLSYEPKKTRVQLNNTDPVNQPSYVIDYSMQFWIMSVIDGILDDADVPE